MGSGLDRLLSHGHFQKVAWLSFVATVLPWHTASDLEHLNCQLKMVHSKYCTLMGPGTGFFLFLVLGVGELGRIWNLGYWAECGI